MKLENDPQEVSHLEFRGLRHLVCLWSVGSKFYICSCSQASLAGGWGTVGSLMLFILCSFFSPLELLVLLPSLQLLCCFPFCHWEWWWPWCLLSSFAPVCPWQRQKLLLSGPSCGAWRNDLMPCSGCSSELGCYSLTGAYGLRLRWGEFSSKYFPTEKAYMRTVTAAAPSFANGGAFSTPEKWVRIAPGTPNSNRSHGDWAGTSTI